MIDPVEWYMRKDDEENTRRPGSTRRGSVAGWGILSREGRHPEPGPPPRWLEESERRTDAWLEAREAVLARKYAVFFEAKARELADRGEVTIEGTDFRIGAKLIRFRKAMVYEDRHSSPRGTGHGKSGIDRDLRTDLTPILAVYLQNSVLNGVPDDRADPGPLR